MFRMKITRRMKEKKGQIRGIDFTVSLLLFLILLSQVILVIVNAQILVRSRSTLNRDDVDFISSRLLHNEGTAGWGYSQELPDEFGLKDETYPWMTSSAYLDPGKLSRLNQDGMALFNLYHAPNFQFLDYTRVRYLIGEENIDFRLKARLPLEISLSQPVNGENDIFITVKHTDKPFPSVNTRTDIFWVYLTNGTVRHRFTRYTNTTGQITVEDIVVQTDTDPYIVLIISRSNTEYGLGWFVSDHFEVLHGKTISDEGNFYSHLGCLENRSTAIITDAFVSSSFAVASNRNHTVSLVYPASDGYSYSNSVLTDITNMTLINTEESIPAQGLVTAVSSAYHDNSYYFTVYTLPTIFNDDGSTDFPVYPTFQDYSYSIESNNIENIISSSYIALCRDISLIVTIDIWERPI